MAVNQLRPYERHMVSNISTLLPTGLTLADLGVGQIGIFDSKTNKSVTAPTYAANKSIYFAQGTPDRSGFPEGAGVPNMYRTSHPLEGKRLISLFGKAASRGRGEIVTLGNTGAVGDTKTLTAKPGSTFYYWIRLTGEPIFNLNPDKAKGVVIQGAVQMPCADECSDNCSSVDCQTIVDRILEDYNGHYDQEQQRVVGAKLLPGGQRANQYFELCGIKQCAEPAALTTEEFYTCSVTIPDSGSQSDLGNVQAQAGLGTIVRSARTGIFSTYTTAPATGAGCPADFVQGAGSVISNCTDCPTGFSPVAAQDEWTIKHTAGWTAPTVTGGTVVLLITDTAANISTYSVTTSVGLYADAAEVEAAAAHFNPGSAAFVGVIPASCSNDQGTTYTYSPNGVVCHKVQVEFTIDLQVGDCDADKDGTELLAELIAAYPDDRIARVSDASGVCVHTYTLTTFSKNCVPDNCCADDVVFPDVPGFKGTAWTPVAIAQGTAPCYCGIKGTSIFQPRKESECTFGNWAHQVDWVHAELSSHNPDWRSTDLCEQDPIATRIQSGAYPNGEGPAVVRIEKQDRMYDFDYFYLSPVLREAFDFYFEAKFDQYYDMVAVNYNYTYASNDGFGQLDTDNLTQYFWLPETETGALTTALNGYAASLPILVDPVVI